MVGVTLYFELALCIPMEDNTATNAAIGTRTFEFLRFHGKEGKMGNGVGGYWLLVTDYWVNGYWFCP